MHWSGHDLFRFVGKVITVILVLLFFFSLALADSLDTALYPRTESRLYGMMIWNEQSFLSPLAQVTARHREKNWYLWTKYDLSKGQLVELYGTYKPYSWLGLQTGQFRTPAGFDVAAPEYALFSGVPFSRLVPHTYDRGMMATVLAPHVTLMVAGVNGEGYEAAKTDNKTDVAGCIRGVVGPVQATFSRQENSERTYTSGSLTVNDPHLTASFIRGKLLEFNNEEAVSQFQWYCNYWPAWRFGAQYVYSYQNIRFGTARFHLDVELKIWITAFAVERRFGDLGRVRVEWVPASSGDGQWRLTFQQGVEYKHVTP